MPAETTRELFFGARLRPGRIRQHNRLKPTAVKAESLVMETVTRNEDVALKGDLSFPGVPNEYD